MERKLLCIGILSYCFVASGMEQQVEIAPVAQEQVIQPKEGNRSRLRTPLVVVGFTLAAVAVAQYWNRKKEEEGVVKGYWEDIVRGYIPYDVRAHLCSIATALNPGKSDGFKGSLAKSAFRRVNPLDTLQSIDYVLSLAYGTTLQKVMSSEHYDRMQKDLKRYRRLLVDYISETGVLPARSKKSNTRPTQEADMASNSSQKHELDENGLGEL